MTIPFAPIKRIIRNQGLRPGKDATEELRNILEDTGVTISERAIKLAKHAGRRTVRKEDIILAVAELTNE